MKQTVVGLFNKPDDAQQAVQHLTSNGFTMDNVDMSLSYANTGSDNQNFNFDKDDRDDDEHESGIARFFKNLFGDDDDDASRYSKASRGKSIVTVHALSEDEAHKAADILDDCGAVDVDEDANEYDYNTTGAAPVGVFNEGTGTHINAAPAPDAMLDYDATGTGMSADMTTGTSRTSDADLTDKKIPIIEENIEVGKRTVQTGGVRLKSRIVEKPVEEDLRLRSERVYVQRNPVDRPASSTDLDTFTEGEIEVTEHAEVPVVNKEARVVEEVSLGKDVDERTETVRDTVRKTEVDIEDLDNKSSQNTTWKDTI